MPSPSATVALSGCGAVAALCHAPALQILETEGVLRVTALFDPDAAATAALGRRFPRARRVSGFEALLQEPPELVIVASPAAAHAEQCSAALRAGCAVFCEKPLATRLADAEALVALARQTGRALAVGMLRRYFPATRTLHALIRSGAIGTVRSVRCFEGEPFHWPVRSPGYFTRAASGGGVLMDIGAHALDLLGWWFGPCTALSYEDDAMGGVEAECRIALSFGEIDGEVRLSRMWQRPNRYEIVGTRGRLGWTVHDADHIDIALEGTSYRLAAAIREGSRPAATFHHCVLDQLRAAAAAAAGAPAEIVPAAETLPALALIERCYAERKTMHMDWLDAAEQRAADRLAGAAP
ncbi:MAG: Gfo/Idh/MocA family oxidoreductase [Rhodospirillales bacterium]|nr:Gfo/Idh/MocA family oxidoreductase [Rhodospirillales bacterium]